MKTWGIILAIAAACMAGCTPSYRVNVNTFADPNRPVTQGASVYVVEDPNAGNPILRRQIAVEDRRAASGLRVQSRRDR